MPGSPNPTRAVGRLEITSGRALSPIGNLARCSRRSRLPGITLESTSEDRVDAAGLRSLPEQDALVFSSGFHSQVETEHLRVELLIGTRLTEDRAVVSPLRGLPFVVRLPDASLVDRVGSRGLRPVTLPHHRTCGFPHPAVEPAALRAGVVAPLESLGPGLASFRAFGPPQQGSTVYRARRSSLAVPWLVAGLGPPWQLSMRRPAPKKMWVIARPVARAAGAALL